MPIFLDCLLPVKDKEQGGQKQIFYGGQQNKKKWNSDTKFRKFSWALSKREHSGNMYTYFNEYIGQLDYTRRVTIFSQIRFQYQNRGSLCIAFQSFRPSIHSYWQRLLQREKWSTNSIIFCQNYVRNRADQANKA